MTNLTTFQNQLISDLQNEFAKLNPASPTSGKFTIAAVKQDIDSEKQFRESVFNYNKTIAQQLQEDFCNQIDTFNREFSPVIIKWDYYAGQDNADRMFSDDYTMKNPHSAEIGLSFINDKDGAKLYVLYDFKPVEIETTSNTIRLYKITGLLWTRRNWVRRKSSDAPMYKTFDEFVQNDKSFQQDITSKYNQLTK